MCTHLFDEPVLAFIVFIAAAHETSILGECFIQEREGGKRVLDVNKVVTRLMRVLIKSFSRLSSTLHLRLGEDTQTVLSHAKKFVALQADCS